MSTEEKSRTPQLRFPGFTGEWKEKKLGDVTNNEDNKRCPIARMNRKDGVYPYYGANGIQDYVDDYIFDGDYLLVGEDGSVLSKENSPVIHWASGKFWVNNHAHVLSQKGNVNLKFVSYNLSTIKIQGLVTGIPLKLNQENLNNISLPIPSKPAEQQKIADCLSNLDALINSQTQKVEALKEKKKGLLQQMFPQDGETTPRLRFPSFTEEWKEKEFGKLIKESKLSSKKEDEDILLTSAIDGVFLNSERFSHQRGQTTIGYRKVKKGMLILSAQNLHLGNANVNMRFESGLVSPAYKVYSIHGCLPEFIAQWVKKESTKDFFLRATTQGASLCRKNVVWEQLYKQTILIPSSVEQQKIAECLFALDDQITAESARLDTLKDHKKGLMQKLFPEPSK